MVQKVILISVGGGQGHMHAGPDLTGRLGELGDGEG